MTLTLPTQHPERKQLADEVHARPPMMVATPARASHLAVVVNAEERARELAHLNVLCALHGAAVPPKDATHLQIQLGDVELKWERHGEFSGYTFLLEGDSDKPFIDTPLSRLPSDWVSNIPGRTISASHVYAGKSMGTQLSTEELQNYFEGHAVMGAAVGDGAGQAFSDFQIYADGFCRFVLIDHSLTTRQVGRMLQRLLEIDTYRMMALLALPVARELSPRILKIEQSLAELTSRISHETGKDEQLLHELTRLAAEVESGLAQSQFRFGACRAYAALVNTRIADLRERRIEGVPTISEFMARRFAPAVATCNTVSQRLHELSERVAQASSLLSTRVNIAREQQNQQLLEAMNRRGKLQLRLQQTVEGLSVAAIVYYLAGLIGYLAKGATLLGVNVKPELVVALSIPVLAVVIYWAIHRVRHRIEKQDTGS